MYCVPANARYRAKLFTYSSQQPYGVYFTEEDWEEQRSNLPKVLALKW